MSGKNYRDLIAWQKGVDLVEEVYRVTRSWPREELYGLTNQVRRAAVAIPANVAEGQGRNTPKEFLYFLTIAYGSLREVETHLVISHRLKYIDNQANEALLLQAAEVGRLLQGLMKSLRSPTSVIPDQPPGR